MQREAGRERAHAEARHGRHGGSQRGQSRRLALHEIARERDERTEDRAHGKAVKQAAGDQPRQARGQREGQVPEGEARDAGEEQRAPAQPIREGAGEQHGNVGYTHAPKVRLLERPAGEPFEKPFARVTHRDRRRRCSAVRDREPLFDLRLDGAGR